MIRLNFILITEDDSHLNFITQVLGDFDDLVIFYCVVTDNLRSDFIAKRRRNFLRISVGKNAEINYRGVFFRNIRWL